MKCIYHQLLFQDLFRLFFSVTKIVIFSKYFSIRKGVDIDSLNECFVLYLSEPRANENQ